jgi:hypothetical protein
MKKSQGIAAAALLTLAALFAVTVTGCPTDTGTKETKKPPAGSWKPPSTPVGLTADQWKEGAITASVSEIWYSFPVTIGKDYYIWWNDADGNGDYDLDVKVSARHGNKGEEIFTGIEDAWDNPRAFTAILSGTVYVKVERAGSGGTGSFGIVYSADPVRPGGTEPKPWTPPSSPTPLTADQWKDGDLTVAEAVDWYSFNVTQGETYYIWWNGVDYGDETKTGDVEVLAQLGDGSTVIEWGNNGWSKLHLFTAEADGTIYIKVRPLAAMSNYTGTYAVAYSTSNTRPGGGTIIPPDTWTPPANHIPLTEREWKEGEITANGEVWFSFDASPSCQYWVWWNDSSGDGKYSLDVKVNAKYSNGTNIFNEDSGWDAHWEFTTDVSGTVYLRVYPFNPGETGKFAIVYSGLVDGVTMPERPDNGSPSKPDPVPVPLTVDVWKDASLTGGESIDYYSFAATAQLYYIWWDDSDHGDSGKTGNIEISAVYSDGSVIQNWPVGNLTTPLPMPLQLMILTPGTVYLKVRPRHGVEECIGTYRIVYSTSNTKPGEIITPDPWTPPGGHIPLTEDQWKVGDITSVREIWYSFPATDGTRYYLWCNDANGYGDSTVTVTVSACYDNESSITFNREVGWDLSARFDAAKGGTVFVKVSASSGTGSFAIAYNTSGNRPDGGGTWTPPGSSVTPLTADQWTDGTVLNGNSVNYYSITVTAGTPYYVWWNGADEEMGDGTKTGDVQVTARYGDGKMIFDRINNGWATPRQFTPDAGGTVYLMVRPFNEMPNNAGSYGIVYSLSNTKPGNAADTFTANQWKEGVLLRGIDEDRYTITVTAGTTYYVWWNDDGQGNGDYTADVYVSAFDSDEAPISLGGVAQFLQKDDGWTTPCQFTAAKNDTVSIRVRPFGGQDRYAGTYAIAYNTTGDRP